MTAHYYECPVSLFTEKWDSLLAIVHHKYPIKPYEMPDYPTGLQTSPYLSEAKCTAEELNHDEPG